MRWLRIASVPMLHEAHLMLHRLQACGIPGQVRADRSGLAGVIPVADAQAELWVPEEQVRPALLELGLVSEGKLSLVEVDAVSGAVSLPGAEGGELSLPEAGELCPACGEDWEPGFTECWSCQAPWPAG